MQRLQKLPFASWHDGLCSTLRTLLWRQVEVMSAKQAAEFANAAHWSLAYYEERLAPALFHGSSRILQCPP